MGSMQKSLACWIWELSETILSFIDTPPHLNIWVKAWCLMHSTDSVRMFLNKSSMAEMLKDYKFPHEIFPKEQINPLCGECG